LPRPPGHRRGRWGLGPPWFCAGAPEKVLEALGQLPGRIAQVERRLQIAVADGGGNRAGIGVRTGDGLEGGAVPLTLISSPVAFAIAISIVPSV